MNLLDKAISYISPAAAADRVMQRARLADIQNVAPTGWGLTYGGYEGGNDASRARKQYAWGRSRIGDEDSMFPQYNRDTLILEARDLYRNNEIVHAAVNRIATYSVWQGIRAIAKTENKDWNYLAEMFFNERYWYTSDYRNRESISLADIQRWIVISSYLDGGIGFIMLRNGQIQPIEYERLRTPNDFQNNPLVRHGVRFSERGNLLGYYICKRGKTGNVDSSEFDYVPKENFIHTHAPFFRADQSVGVPRLAAVISKLRDYDETDRYQLLKVKHDSMLLLKEKKSGGWGPGAQGGLPFRQKIDGEGGKKIEEHDWGMIWRGEADDDISSFESRNPQPTWAPYLEHHLRVIAPAFDLPYEYLMMIFSAGSYTAQRSASMHARHTFLREHYRICNQFMKRLWNWRVAKAMKEGDLPMAPMDARSGMSEWYWVKFSKPDYGWLNPGEHAKGVKEMWNLGLTSLDGIIDGDEDRDEVFKSKIEDIEAAQRLAEQFNAANPNAEPLGWRDVISSLSPGQQAGGTRMIGENRGEDIEE